MKKYEIIATVTDEHSELYGGDFAIKGKTKDGSEFNEDMAKQSIETLNLYGLKLKFKSFRVLANK